MSQAIELPPVVPDDLRAMEDAPDPAFAPAACALVATGEALWSSCVSGFSPALQRRFEWMSAPRVGDLVVVYMAFEHPIHRVGEFIGAWTHFSGPDDPRDGARQEVFYVASLDGRGMKWANVKLLRVPRSAAEYRELDG